jgi:CYTH domain-containing protein
MGREIERKYRVGSDAWRDEADNGVRIVQGYLSLDPDRTVRVRRRGDDAAMLTVKGRNDGPTRAEFEYEIPLDDAEELLELCIKPLIEKVRHHCEVDGRTWEIDVFGGASDGLVLAEVELDDADVVPEPPSWVDSDVTDDPDYYNANLVRNPLP